MKSAYVSSKGQLVIPADIRRRYGIKAGTKIQFIEKDDQIVLQPVTKALIRSLCGIYKDEKSLTAELLRERAKDREREDAKFEKFRPR
ncbi:MAG: AbrB/MazE/SpoVT family DNA-binding domain-containing protein [Acidobacteria bacterium]|nr:AbrB/MazE/SpoVT family DNA-binding domain-containing protein [Acidobacteriota bacterium]